MAGSNSSKIAPFLTYLTVFKSRLGATNIVLGVTEFGFMPAATLLRKVKTVLSERVTVKVDDVSSASFFEYLAQKHLVGTSTARSSGRYVDFTLKKNTRWTALNRDGLPIPEVKIFQSDIWLSDPSLPSTVGVPTAENADEVIELCHQIGLITRTKNNWTAAGQLVTGLRARFARGAGANPMVLGAESVALLRQVIRVDGLMIHRLLEALLAEKDETLRRNAIVEKLPHIAELALSDAHRLRRSSPELAEGKQFVSLLRKTAASTQGGPRGPGVLEHRTSPRLEWLTDFGALSKEGLPRNAFEYSRTDDARVLLNLFNSVVDPVEAASHIAIEYWRNSRYFDQIGQDTPRTRINSAFLEGYKIMKRTVGPASLEDVCFAAALLLEDRTLMFDRVADELVKWAAATPGVTLSGGRYTRKPQLIHVQPSLLVE